MDPTARFSDRVADYVRYRPGYPDALTALLRDEAGVGPGAVVADLGAGTGISTEVFLRLGAEVSAVEPNAAMREAAETQFAGDPRFRSVDGRAEATGLPAASVDVAAAGQAFHWFDVEATRAELLRILRPEGWVAVFWNTRRTEGAFLEGYEVLLQRFGTDYREVDHRRVDPGDLFQGPHETRSFPYAQTFDFEGLRGRLLSSSYAPGPGHPNHAPMLAALRALFDAHARGGEVRFAYDTEVHLGALSR
jgi:SAM-dependent methyltransferase